MNLIIAPKFVKFLGKNIEAITLFPIGIYLADSIYLEDKKLLNHEFTHWQQSKELLGIFFYLFYGLEFILKLPFYGKYTYFNVSFEREAIYFETALIAYRKPYNWLYYIFHKI